MHPRQEIDGIHCVTSHLPQIKLIADKVPGLKSCSLYNVYIYIYLRISIRSLESRSPLIAFRYVIPSRAIFFASTFLFNWFLVF